MKKIVRELKEVLAILLPILVGVAVGILVVHYGSKAFGAEGIHIVKQIRNPDGIAVIKVRNTLPRAAWLWFECKNAISVEPIGIPGRRVVTIHLRALDPIAPEPCILTWKLQDKGGSP